MKRIKLWVFLPLTLLLFSCKEETTILSIKTDSVEILPLINIYNSENRDTQIEVYPSSMEKETDIILYRGQPGSLEKKTMDLSGLFFTELKKENYYEDLTEFGLKKKGRSSLPLAFDIPGLVVRKEIRGEYTITPEELLERCLKTKSTSRKIPFSPLWNSEFLYWHYITSYPEIISSKKYLDEDAFNATVDYIKALIKHNGGEAQQTVFNKKYMYLPPEELLLKNIIDFYPMTLTEFLKTEDAKREKLSFLALKNNGMVSVTDSVVNIAVSDSSPHKSKALKAVAWMMKTENQGKYLNSTVNNKDSITGFLGSLSTNIYVTENIIPVHYSYLKNTILAREELTIHQELPLKWESLKEFVLIPSFIKSYNLKESERESVYDELYQEWVKKYKK